MGPRKVKERSEYQIHRDHQENGHHHRCRGDDVHFPGDRGGSDIHCALLLYGGPLSAQSRYSTCLRIHAFDEDRKSTRLNSSHLVISYAVFCLKKKKNYTQSPTFVVRSTHDVET